MVTLLSGVDDLAAPIGCPSLLLACTAAQSIANNSNDVISWSSAIRNTGPSSWWSSGTPGSIVMPWAGLYSWWGYISFAINNSTGVRGMHLNSTTTVGQAQFVGGTVQASGTTQELSRGCESSGYIQASASGVYVMTAYQSSGSSTTLSKIHSGFAGNALLGFTYLG